MRTTINIDDDVLKSARQRALEEGRSLGDLVTEALRVGASRAQASSRPRFEAVTGGEGGTLSGVDITDNASVRALLDER